MNRNHALRLDGHDSRRRRQRITSVQLSLCNPADQNDDEDADRPDGHASTAHRFAAFRLVHLVLLADSSRLLNPRREQWGRPSDPSEVLGDSQECHRHHDQD